MQHLSAYLMEIPDLNLEDGKKLYEEIGNAVDGWLISKGVTEPSLDASTFISKTEDELGTVKQGFFSNDEGELREIILEEPTYDGHTFRTTLRVIRTSLRVVAYLTLAARNSFSVIRPGFVVPRCPDIIRRLGKLRNDWRLGDTALGFGEPLFLAEEEDGIALAENIYSSRRSVPIITVSTSDGQEYWDELSQNIAYDLAGLAVIYKLSEATSWGLTKELGQRWSCYGGAVRLYWPTIRGQNTAQVTGRVWTPEQLGRIDVEGRGQGNLRRQLRAIVMGAAALGVEPPFEIQEVKSFRSRERMRELEKKGQVAAEELALAREFFKENAELREANEALHQVIAQWKGGRTDKIHDGSDNDTDEDVEEAEARDEMGAPIPGEIRFYKKTHSAPGYDYFARVNDCGHNNWEPAHSADKAWKGLIRLEGRDNWKTATHCASCTGGGVWRVQW